jgi:hypothetical protein
VRGRGSLGKRKAWLRTYMEPRPFLRLTTSVGMDDSLDVMADFAKAFYPPDVSIGTTQRAFGRVLLALCDDGFLWRYRVGNKEWRSAGQPAWCYVYEHSERRRAW